MMMIKRLLVPILFFFSTATAQFNQLPLEQQPLRMVDSQRIVEKQTHWRTVFEQRAWRRGVSWCIIGALGIGVTYALVRSWFQEPAPIPLLDEKQAKDKNQADARYKEWRCESLIEEVLEQRKRQTWTGLFDWCAKKGVERGIELAVASLILTVLTRSLNASQSAFQGTLDKITGFHEDQLLVQMAQATLQNLNYLTQSWHTVMASVSKMDDSYRDVQLELLSRVAIDTTALVDGIESSYALISVALERHGIDDAGSALQRSLEACIRLFNQGVGHQQAAYSSLLGFVTAGKHDEVVPACNEQAMMTMLHSLQGSLMRLYQDAGRVLYDIDCLSLGAGSEHEAN